MAKRGKAKRRCMSKACGIVVHKHCEWSSSFNSYWVVGSRGTVFEAKRGGTIPRCYALLEVFSAPSLLAFILKQMSRLVFDENRLCLYF